MATKGSLETVEGPSIKVGFLFNPKEYSISKQNTWSKPEANRGSDSTTLHFGGGNPMGLKMQLFFDTYLDGTDVRPNYTEKLFQMMEINTRLPEGSTTQSTGAPPKLKFTWGTTWSFHCYLESLAVNYTLFLGDGTPVRATADLQLKQAVDENAQPGTNPTSGGEGGEHVWLVGPRDRLDLIAFKEYGDAKMWRIIAQANGIVDPHKIMPGQRLIIPPPGS
ncbi:MAG: CIS tube protein [Thermomicrobiales bacterium]